MDIIDNVIPYIGGEEEKVEWEPCKMLGKLAKNQIELADITFSVHTNRVAVIDGHTVCASVQLENPVESNVAIQALRDFSAHPSARDLPSKPRPVIEVREEADRPQPRLDRLTGNQSIAEAVVLLFGHGAVDVIGPVAFRSASRLRDETEYPPRLGWDSWLTEQPLGWDADDSVFSEAA